MPDELDRSQFQTVMDELGVELAFDDFVALVGSVRFSTPKRVADRLFHLAHEALHGPHGYAWEYSIASTFLVARDGDALVFGLQGNTNARRPFPPWGWKFERWSKNLEKNREQVSAWARAETRGVVRGKLVRAPVRAQPDADAREDGARLLAAVVARPEDAAARRVYADWLLEQGDPRGDLIRLHQEGRDTWEFERKHTPVMLAPYAKLDAGTSMPSGFIDELTAYAGNLARQPEIFEREPFRTLHLVVMKPDELSKLAKSCGEQLRRITHLELEGRKSKKHRAAVETRPAVLAPSLSSVKKLHVERLRENLAEWRAFLEGLVAVEELLLDDVPREVFTLLDEPTILPALRRITIGFQRWANGRGAAESLAVAKTLARRKLKSVYLNSWHPGTDAMVKVVDALASRKTKLTLANCSMDEDVKRALSKRAGVTIDR